MITRLPAGEHLGQRAERQVERGVPRHDVADDALGLVANACPGSAVERRVDGPGIVGHPRAQPLRGDRGAAGHAEYLNQVGEQAGVGGEVGGHGGADLVAVAEHHRGKRAQLGPALGGGGERIGQGRGALDVMEPAQLGDRLPVVGFGRGRWNEGEHGASWGRGRPVA
jgi:hypothetical protein